jgi:large subunit ribosomal protein L31
LLSLNSNKNQESRDKKPDYNFLFMSAKIKQSAKIPYYTAATVECACGQKYKTGSTVRQMKVDICSACHPFFTGTQKLIDTAGQVDKFKARVAKTKKMKKGKIRQTKGGK